MSLFFYAETAFHHEGNFEYLLSLIDAASESGCHGVKFQMLLDINNFMTTDHPLYDQAKKWIFSKEEWTNAISYTAHRGLKVICMPCDRESILFIQDNDALRNAVDFYDIHPTCFFYKYILEFIKATKLPVIMSVGGMTLEEIVECVDFLAHDQITLMAGFQSFPSNLEDVKINRIRFLKDFFPCLKVGYADHSGFNDEMAEKSMEYAYLLGATVFEKHLTLNEGKKRVDYESGVGVEKLRRIIANLTTLHRIVPPASPADILLSEKEMTYRKRQKKVVARSPLPSNTTLSGELLTLKTNGKADGFNKIEDLEGRVLKCSVAQDQAIQWSDLV